MKISFNFKEKKYNLAFYSFSIKKPKTWGRKGRCPDCDAQTGSSHKKYCSYDYIATKRNRYSGKA